MTTARLAKSNALDYLSQQMVRLLPLMLWPLLLVTFTANASFNCISLNQNGITYLSTIAAGSNRLLNVQGPTAKTYSYDAAGNITSDGTATFTWNAAGRLYQTTSGGQIYTYTDNGLGERILKNSPALSNGPYRFVYDHAGHLIGEYDKNNSLRQETVWLGDTPVAVVKPAPTPQQIQVYFIHDHLNAPRVILNNANIPIWRWDTADAFGATLPNEDPDGDGNQFEYNLRFPGQYYDQETGLHYNYFRDYDPSTGRYIESDPMGLSGGLNIYSYVNGNPVNATDSSGLIIDTLADIGFIAYDLYKLASDGACERNSNLTALGLDFVGAIVPGVTGLGAASRAAKGAEEGIGFARRQLQHGFKYAEDFGAVGNANNKTLAEFSTAIQNHVAAPGTQVIQGTYRGQSATHFVDPNTGLNVIRDTSGNFLSGWELSPQQLEHVLTSGKLGGG